MEFVWGSVVIYITNELHDPILHDRAIYYHFFLPAVWAKLNFSSQPKIFGVSQFAAEMMTLCDVNDRFQFRWTTYIFITNIQPCLYIAHKWCHYGGFGRQRKTTVVIDKSGNLGCQRSHCVQFQEPSVHEALSPSSSYKWLLINGKVPFTYPVST